MPTFIALLRGVNVGKAKRVPMANLRGLLTGLGFEAVQTLLNSGNVVFQAAGTSALAHAKSISRAISLSLGFEVPVVVKSRRDLAAIIGENVLAAAAPDHSRLLVAFAQDAQILAALKDMAALVTPTEGFVVGRHAAYLHCADGILQSKVGLALLGKAGQAVTTRNWATTLKLHSMVSKGDADSIS